MNLDFHFNEWVFLAKADPELFEQRRRQAIARFLNQSGVHRQRLEVLQSKIDRERERADSPQQAVVAISGLMCASLAELAGGMTALTKDLKQLRSNRLLSIVVQGGKAAESKVTA